MTPLSNWILIHPLDENHGVEEVDFPLKIEKIARFVVFLNLVSPSS